VDVLWGTCTAQSESVGALAGGPLHTAYEMEPANVDVTSLAGHAGGARAPTTRAKQRLGLMCSCSFLPAIQLFYSVIYLKLVLKFYGSAYVTIN